MQDTTEERRFRNTPARPAGASGPLGAEEGGKAKGELAAGEHLVGPGLAGGLEHVGPHVLAVGDDDHAGIPGHLHRLEGAAAGDHEVDDYQVGALQATGHVGGPAHDLAVVPEVAGGVAQAGREHEVVDAPEDLQGPERTGSSAAAARSGYRLPVMHPIERLRWVARAPEGDVSVVVAEAADALAAFADDSPGLVTACRRLIERRPACGPLWWLASRVLCALDPALEAGLAAADLGRDPTPAALAAALPGGRVAVVGWPEQAALALTARRGGPGDDRVLVVDSAREGRRLVHWLEAHGLDARLLAPGRAAEAGRRSALVLLEAHALGPASFVAAAGSGALARVAREAGTPLWLVAGVGRTLPAPLFDALLVRLDGAGAPGARGVPAATEILPLDLVDEVAGPGGLVAPSVAAARAVCPVAPELLRFAR